MADNAANCAIKVIDHGYSRLENIVDSVCAKSPVYAETVEISTSEDNLHLSSGSGASGKHGLNFANYFHNGSCSKIFTSSSSVEIKKELQTDDQTDKFVSPVNGGVFEDAVDGDDISQDVKGDLKCELNDVQESYTTSTFAESINVETKEETVLNSVTKYGIDYSNIKKYVSSEPIIFYHYGSVTLKCMRLNNKSFVKSFECSTLGLSDKETLENIQRFINSPECIRHLAVVDKLDFTNLSEFVKDVRLMRISEEQVRLVCTYPDGHTLTKLFPATKLSIKDPGTRKMVQEFISSEKGRLWVAEGCKGRKGKWIRVGEVPTGVDTKRFLSNNVKFDVKQRFVYDKESLEVVRDKEVLPASVSSHANWGSSHRPDDCFSLKVPQETVASVVLARFNLECSSLTSKCKTVCGSPISDVTIINGKFSCCGKIKEAHHCSNCMIDNTSQWYRIENDTIICNTCYKYYQRRGVHRPYCRKNGRKKKIHEAHTKCKWKMKLELRGDDITKWIIYENADNAKDHRIEIPCQIRPTITMRDNWDKLRSLAKLTPKQIFKSESHLRKSMPEIQSKVGLSTFQSIKTRATVIDSRKRNVPIEVEGGIPISLNRKSSRITIEKYFEHLVFQQRENIGGNRDYHLVILSADCIDNLSELEIPVEGYCEQPKFKNGVIVVYYDPFEGVAGAFLISCMEEGLGLTLSHELTFRIMDNNETLSSILQQEKHLEYKYSFKAAQEKSDVEEPVKVSRKSPDNPSSSLFNFSNIIEFVAEKPRVVKISDTRVRLQCLLPEGKFLTKVFPCSELGVQDPETQRTIQAFLNSKDCKEWIERKGSETWVRVGEVATGTDTEQYLFHTIKFEVMQRFFYHRKFLNIIHNGGTMLSALSRPDSLKSSSRSRSGIHKVGNKFSLKLPQEEVGHRVVATMYIDCASTSEYCKTKCGRPVNGVSVIDGCFSCCGLPREQFNVCCNCFTDNSDRWVKIAEHSVLCHTCHNYYRRKNEHRPLGTNKTKQKKIHETHLKCDWKMKLELRGSNVMKWQIFKHHMNKEAHETKPVARSKVSMSIFCWTLLKLYYY